MAIYETIPTSMLSMHNEVDSTSELPELVHLEDLAKTVFIDFSKITPVTIPRNTPIDEALHDLKIRHLQMLLVEDRSKVVGLISQEDILSEQPIRVMQEKSLTRPEITVEMIMKPRNRILVIDITHLKHARVGHIINTLKKHSANYILVVKKIHGDKHLIRGLFSASQIGKQLHTDLSAIVTRLPETIVELHRERKG